MALELREDFFAGGAQFETHKGVRDEQVEGSLVSRVEHPLINALGEGEGVREGL